MAKASNIKLGMNVSMGGKKMKVQKPVIEDIETQVSIGRYNYANTKEKSCLIVFAIKVDSEWKRLSFHLKPENEDYWRARFEAYPIDTLEEAYKEWTEKTLYSTDSKSNLEMMEFIREHADEIMLVFLEKKITYIKAKQKELLKQKNEIFARINSYKLAQRYREEVFNGT